MTTARKILLHERIDPAPLEKFATMLLRLMPGQLAETMAEFHNLAGQLPYAGDSDYGALLLESLAEETDDRALRREFLQAATWRARWCAQGASSGGEGLARSIDLKRIESKLDRLR